MLRPCNPAAPTDNDGSPSLPQRSPGTPTSYDDIVTSSLIPLTDSALPERVAPESRRQIKDPLYLLLFIAHLVLLLILSGYYAPRPFEGANRMTGISRWCVARTRRPLPTFVFPGRFCGRLRLVARLTRRLVRE